eukprot:TRINITY_DN70998_c0_g1_i1.p1 TRINITY_DN70998_c0_g1~~TRINITY_DN70998_c0_g1_i1.p1  ORF type:complete len:397 (+),score=16.83 TRINITY_DN70998_c0_g1_i1:111-1193(+)
MCSQQTQQQQQQRLYPNYQQYMQAIHSTYSMGNKNITRNYLPIKRIQSSADKKLLISAKSMEKSDESKFIMITGCNKGVGFGILENLAMNNPNYRFLAAVRSLMRGEQALNEIKEFVPNIFERVSLKELDISKSKSIDEFVNWVKDHGLKIDCLVNNAAIAFQTSKIEPKLVEETFQTNVFGTIELTEKLLPYISDNGKIVNITTDQAMFGTLKSPDFEKRLRTPDLTKEDLFNVAKEYHDKVSTHHTWLTDHPFPKQPSPIYSFSKFLISIYTQILAKYPEVKQRSIQVYSCSPGWVKTDIGGPMAEKTVREGSICPCNVINLPWKYNESLQGQFFFNSEVTPLQPSHGLIINIIHCFG